MFFNQGRWKASCINERHGSCARRLVGEGIAGSLEVQHGRTGGEELLTRYISVEGCPSDGVNSLPSPHPFGNTHTHTSPIPSYALPLQHTHTHTHLRIGSKGSYISKTNESMRWCFQEGIPGGPSISMVTGSSSMSARTVMQWHLEGSLCVCVCVCVHVCVFTFDRLRSVLSGGGFRERTNDQTDSTWLLMLDAFRKLFPGTIIGVFCCQ